MRKSATGLFHCRGAKSRISLSVIFSRSIFSSLFFIGALLLSGLSAVAADSATPDALQAALTARHVVSTSEDLERLAGGEAAYVRRLMQLRLEEMPPYLALRAEKLLLNFAAREEVMVALDEDLADPERRGLAQIIALHIDLVPADPSRARLAKSVVQRAERDPEFASYGKLLAESRDPIVRHIAEPLAGL